jgi:hypothetical protein
MAQLGPIATKAIIARCSGGRSKPKMRETYAPPLQLRAAKLDGQFA